MELPVRTAAEVMDAGFEARWAERQAARRDAVLQRILRLFLERGGPIAPDALASALPGGSPADVGDALRRLDADDLVFLRDGRVELAYPFAAGPNPFEVVLADGRERYACCAIDALGLAPMVGERLTVRTRCHHSGTPLIFAVTPEGPGPEAAGVMVWIGPRPEVNAKACTSL
jgi:Alkylmercury lyase